MHGHPLSCLESGHLHTLPRFKTCDTHVVRLDISKNTTLSKKRITHIASSSY